MKGDEGKVREIIVKGLKCMKYFFSSRGRRTESSQGSRARRDVCERGEKKRERGGGINRGKGKERERQRKRGGERGRRGREKKKRRKKGE